MRSISPLRYPGGKSSLADLLMRIRRLEPSRRSAHCRTIRRRSRGLPHTPSHGGGGGDLDKRSRPSHTRFLVGSPAKDRRLLGEDRGRRTVDGRVDAPARHLPRSQSLADRSRFRGLLPEPLQPLRDHCRRRADWGDQTGGNVEARCPVQRSGTHGALPRISQYGGRVHVSGLDGIEFIRSRASPRTFFFIDPPYYQKGSSLYLGVSGPEYHLELAELLKGMREAAWVLTYDDCPEVRALYEGWAPIRPFSLRYAAAERRQGREVLITPEWMDLPLHQGSLAIAW